MRKICRELASRARYFDNVSFCISTGRSLYAFCVFDICAAGRFRRAATSRQFPRRSRAADADTPMLEQLTRAYFSIGLPRVEAPARKASAGIRRLISSIPILP